MKKESDLELAIRLSRASTHLVRKLRKDNDQQAFSLTEQATLSLLDQQKKMLPSSLAAAHHISPQAVSQIINRLQKVGCINRIPHADDGRKVFVALTPAGISALKKIRIERGKWLAKVIQKNLNKEELSHLPRITTIMEKLAANEL
jgi:DNA-binding MarR family transcriptional regulator